MEAKYKKQTHREHILNQPDTYIGSIETADEDVFVHEESGFVSKRLAINPGFYKLVDELLVNAHDQSVRLRHRHSENPVTYIAINCSNELFSIENNGESIDVDMHKEHNMYIPQLVFGELLTSTNYDKDEKKLVGGKNGYGVKLVNIFAKKLDVKIVDSTRSLVYTQTFSDNMTKASSPVVKSCKTKSLVHIEWTPDFARFGLTEITPAIQTLIERRVWDLAMTLGKEVKVTWNGTLVKCRTLTDYAKAFGCETVVAETPNERWQIALTDSPAEKAFNMSFVNGIWTAKGGKHVDAITDQVVTHLVSHLEGKKKVKVRPGLVRDLLGVFVVSSIENPSFTSQTKETLTTKVSAFGSSCKLSEETLKKVVSKLSIVSKILETQSSRDQKENSKTDGKKQSRITGIPKLDDAVFAGTAKSQQCTLILTEGDSAKAMALSGLSAEQRKTFGVYPLKGKVMNVKDTSDSRVEQTKEIAELKKIMGLVSGKKYADTSSLRYGAVLIMTDQDLDGSHIRGLLVNLFHELWHELLAIPGFLTYMATPIVKAKKGKETKTFYTQHEYEVWRKGEGQSKAWTIKYYKGLGTSTRDEAKDYFASMNAVKFVFNGESDEAVDLAFNKARADDRKSWLKAYDKDALLTPGSVPYNEFIHKDLIHFSHYNLERSIPNVMDGLKTSQRKILFAAFKRNLVSEIRVAQFAGYVSEHTGYHHGEASLNDAIVGMAQDFVGSNNIPWFVPAGQFGTRLQGGKDAASPRYIHTHLTHKIRSLVLKDDADVLVYRDDDGLPVEPEWYAPILPMLLVNGSRGIGTGYSTFIPSCNPDVLKTALLAWLRGDGNALRTAPVRPWFAGFKGAISADGIATGIWTAVPKTEGEFIITELPPGTWTADYRVWLEKCVEDGSIKDFTDTSTDVDIHIRVKGVDEGKLAKSLTENIRTTNMHAFNPAGTITKYATLNDILVEYAETRLALYETRRQHLIASHKAQRPYHENLVRFLRSQCVDDPVPNLKRKTLEECNGLLKANSYGLWEGSYAYIMRLPISSFTVEQIAKHEKDLEMITAEIARLEATTPQKLWIGELEKT